MDSSHPNPDHPACGVARQGFAAYLDGSASRSSQRDLRAHLAGCPGCRTEFAGAIALTSHVARAARAARAAQGRQQRRRQQRSLALAGAFSAWSIGSRGAHLRLLLVPAFLILMITRVAPTPSAADRVRVEALQGEVLVGSLPLAVAAAPRALRRGEACVTGPGGRARVSSGAAALVLSGSTILWIEDDEAARVRLGEGTLEVEGGPTLTTSLGVLECSDARARVELSGGELAIEVHAGEVRFFDSVGERAIHAGETVLLP